MDKITFMGHVLSKYGIGPTEDRVKAVVNAKQPETASEVRSFLGLVNFSARYIPDLASASQPLRDLTKKDTKFHWGEEEQRSFDALKDRLANSTTLGYYRSDAKTTIVTDASNVGIGAALVQEYDGEIRVINYASRALSDVEKRYSTTEKEALAVVWACDKFHIYIYGIEFELVTDHKALEVLYGPKSKPSARVERWMMKLMPYTYKIRYIPGRLNIADALSRLIPTGENIDQNKIQRQTEEYVQFVSREVTPVAIPIADVERATDTDPELNAVKNSLNSQHFDKSCAPYYLIRNELCNFGKVILRGTRLVIPKELRLKCVELAHQGHLGVVGTKRQLRSKVWWPNMDRDVEKYVKSCHGCQLVSALPHPEPLTPTPLPTGPWQDVAIDLLGPLPSGHLILVVVDYYSRYYEIEITKDTSSERMIEALETMFSRYGLVNSVTSDNGPQFISETFESYLRDNGVKHRRVTPLHPAANGEVERQNRSLLKRIRIAHAESRDWKKDIRTYLLAYRSTPHNTTGVSPGELMFGRKLRTKLPQVEDMVYKETDEDVRDRDTIAKYKNKLYIDEKRGSRQSDLGEGDRVLVKAKRTNKLDTTFNPTPYTLVGKHGNSCVIESPEGVRYNRNSTQVKKYNDPIPVGDCVNFDNLDITESEICNDLTGESDSAETRESGINLNIPASTVMTPQRPVRVRKTPKHFDEFVLSK